MAVVKIDSKLLKQIEKIVKKNKIKYPSVINFVEKAVEKTVKNDNRFKPKS